MKDFDASVVILTADRLAMLRRLVEALKRQSVTPREILIVDNESSDATASWLRSQAPPFVRPIAGRRDASFAEARNRAVAEARGEWILFIDDDCVPAPGWLERARELAASHDAFGGPVLAFAALPGPEWFDPEMAWAVGLSTPGAFTPEAGYSILPQAANLAVRRTMLLAHPFQTLEAATFADAGARKYAAGREDAELWPRLRVAGCRTTFDPRFVVLHDIDPARINLEYIRERMRWDGRAAAARSAAPRVIEPALNEVARARLPGRRTTAQRLWIERQREYLNACRELGEPSLQGAGWARSRGRAWVRQLAAQTKQAARRRLTPRTEPDFWKGQPEWKRIAVATQGYIGDMVILAALLRALKRRLPPDAELTLIATSRTEALYRGLDVAHRLCFADARGQGRQRIWRCLAQSRPHVIFIPYWHDASPAVVFNHEAAAILTFDRDVGFSHQWWHDQAAFALAKDFTVNELVNLARLFAPLGVAGPPPAMEWPRDPEAAAQAGRLLAETGAGASERLIGIHFGATRAAKFWPLERWAGLLRAMSERWPDCRFVIVGATDLAPQAGALIAQAGAGVRAFNLCGCDDLRIFPELARRMALLISTDSGPRHLAAAVGCPTVGIYGWTDPRRWGAFYNPDRHLAVCAGDPIMTANEIAGDAARAIRRVTVNQVLEAASSLLSNVTASNP